VKGLIERAAHQEDIQLTEGKRFTIVPSKVKTRQHLFIDSLIEWTATAGIHLHTLAFRGKDAEEAPIKPGPYHNLILEKLGITPRDFADNQDDRTRVGGIFSDGSYKMANLTNGSLLVPMDVLRSQGKSGAAVVLLGIPEHWLTAPARILREF
jgi:hypothetical protein